MTKVDVSRVYGKIQYVDAFPDFKIQKVNAFGDFKIQYVSAFPGPAWPGKLPVQLFAPLDREQPVQSGFNGDVIGGCSRPVSSALVDL